MERETISAAGATLSCGQSVMIECPFCFKDGKKMAVTRYADGIGYVCFRASCNKRGSILGGLVSSPQPTREVAKGPLFKPRPYTHPLQDAHGYAAEKLNSIEPTCSWGVLSAGRDSIYYHLSDFRGKSRGWQTRSRDKRIDSGRFVDGTLYGYFTPTYLPPLTMWFVEDPLSAIRLAEADQSAVALLGTHASDWLLTELWDEFPNCRRIYVALDPGAEDAARKIVHKCRVQYGLDAIQIILPTDIHKMTPDQFSQLLDAYT